MTKTSPTGRDSNRLTRSRSIAEGYTCQQCRMSFRVEESPRYTGKSSCSVPNCELKFSSTSSTAKDGKKQPAIMRVTFSDLREHKKKIRRSFVRNNMMHLNYDPL